MIGLLLALGASLSLAAGMGALFSLRTHPVSIRLVGMLGATWTAASTLYVAAIAMLFVSVLEPWPLSRRQGPDTEYAHEGFAFHLQEPVPATVDGVFCREEWGFGGDGITSLRFRFREPEVLEGLIERLGLVPVPADEIPGLRILAGSEWWPPESALKNSNEVYQRSGVDILWVDRETGEAYFQRANF